MSILQELENHWWGIWRERVSNLLYPEDADYDERARAIANVALLFEATRKGTHFFPVEIPFSYRVTVRSENLVQITNMTEKEFDWWKNIHPWLDIPEFENNTTWECRSRCREYSITAYQ